MLTKKENLEQVLGYSISDEKWKEIQNLEIEPFSSRSRTNLIGQKFDRLTVIAKGPTYIPPSGKGSGPQWWTICDCEEHNILLVRSNNLLSHNTRSCGCLKLEKSKENIVLAQINSRIDITNKIFDKLTAIKPTDKRKRGSVLWECKCECGRTVLAAANELNAGRVRSCGCYVESKGVRKIKKILEDNQIPYVTEKTFSTCCFDDTNQHARFDFYVNNDFLIEFDGEQHFEEKDTNYFRDSLEKRQAHDQFKTNWCKLNGIKLIRISYLEIEDLTLDKILNKLT